MNFWDYLWLTLSVFFFVAYLMVLFHVVTDVFRDGDLSGWGRALWLLALVLVPAVTAIVYVVARGGGMVQRSERAARQAREATDDYIRSVATTSPAEQIAAARQLLDQGAVTQEEYETLKARALA